MTVGYGSIVMDIVSKLRSGIDGLRHDHMAMADMADRLAAACEEECGETAEPVPEKEGIVGMVLGLERMTHYDQDHLLMAGMARRLSLVATRTARRKQDAECALFERLYGEQERSKA